jgi:hypothetical protein
MQQEKPLNFSALPAATSHEPAHAGSSLARDLDVRRESPSDMRRYYESFFDRDQLAIAIATGGAWADPELADLVRRAVTSPTIEGQLLRTMVTGEDDTPELAPAIFLQTVAPAAPAVTPASPNPFGSNTVATTTISPLAIENSSQSGSVMDPFAGTRRQATANADRLNQRSSANPNPFADTI